AARKIGRPYGGIVELLALTGQRREEVAGLNWQELDLEQRVWTIPKSRTKNGNCTACGSGRKEKDRMTESSRGERLVDILITISRSEYPHEWSHYCELARKLAQEVNKQALEFSALI